MADMLTADGYIVTLRPVRADDAAQLTQLYGNATENSRYLRFFSLGTGQITDEVARLTRPAVAEHHAVLAQERGQIVGVAFYERLTDPTTAEFAVLVADAWHARGVGTLLIEQLAAHAREHGIAELIGDVLPINTLMLQVAAGASGSMHHDTGNATVRIPTSLSDNAIAAQDARERLAEEHSLRPLLAPRSVAVVGADRSPGGIGHEVLRNIVTRGFTGRVYAVNPNANEVAGCPTAATLSGLPEPVDLVVVAVPAPAVAGVLRDAGACGVRAAMVVTAGFSETGNGVQQRELLAIAREHGMRLVGPNCLGVLNSDPSVRLAATFASDLPASPNGGLAVATQSGAVGIAVLEHASRAELGVSTFVSLGNKADISGNDLLSYWFDDPATRAVALPARRCRRRHQAAHRGGRRGTRPDRKNP